MFKKLREKVEGLDSPEKNGSASPATRRRSSVQGSNRTRQSQKSGISKTDSNSSLASISEADVLSGKVTQDDLLSAFMQRTNQMKKQEIKLSDYEQALKDATKERDKLTMVLEKQQDTAMKRMSELEETYSEGKARMEKMILRLEKKETSLTETINVLRSENKTLKSSVEKFESEKEEFKKKRDKFYEKRDDSEELDDLRMQELAKLKHMLMMREKECEKLSQERDLKLSELLQSQEKNEQLKTSLDTTTKSLNRNVEELEKQMEITETQNITLKNCKDDIIELSSDISNLKAEIASLHTELKKSRANVATLESENTKLAEKYESLKHSSESVMNKANVELDDKQATIDHLKQKIALLEQRVTTDKLPESEQVQALIQERTSLENKLEESHLQLSNIKSTWSVKINQLEQQVANLNKKIVEDQEELVSRDDKISELESSILNATDEFQSKIKELDGEITNNADVCANYVQQIAKLESDLIEQSTTFELEKSKIISSHEKTVQESKIIQEKLECDIQNLSESLKLLSQEKDELSNEVQSAKTDIANFKRSHDEISKSLEKTKTLNEYLEQERDKLNRLGLEGNAKLKVLEEKLASSQSETSTLNDKILSLQKVIEEKSQEIEDKIEKIALKDKELEKYEQSLANSESVSKEVEEKISHLEAAVSAREKELINCKTEIATLKNSQAEESEEVATLKSERSKADELLAERERLIKVQQQRLNDLKKALNKELNKKSGRTENQRTASPRREVEVNGYGLSAHGNSSEEAISDAAIISGNSVDDPNEQKEINVKYLKHVILTFLGGSQSEAQQLVKALAVLLGFNRDEERFVKETLEYRASWFGSKPSSKKVSTRSARR